MLKSKIIVNMRQLHNLDLNDWISSTLFFRWVCWSSETKKTFSRSVRKNGWFCGVNRASVIIQVFTVNSVQSSRHSDRIGCLSSLFTMTIARDSSLRGTLAIYTLVRVFTPISIWASWQSCTSVPPLVINLEIPASFSYVTVLIENTWTTNFILTWYWINQWIT